MKKKLKYPSGLEEKLMRLLLDEKEQYGAQLMQNYIKLYKQPLTEGSFYTTMSRSIEIGFIRARLEQKYKNPRGGRPKKFFTLTQFGKTMLTTMSSLRSISKCV